METGKKWRNGAYKRNESHAYGAHPVSHAVVAMATAWLRQCYIIFALIATTAIETSNYIIKGTYTHKMCSKCY